MILSKTPFSLSFFLCIFALSIALPNSAHAQLTEDSIKEFIKTTTDISSGHTEDMDEGDIEAYLEKHLHKKARFKSSIKYNIPGFPTQQTSMSLKKHEYIDGINKGSEALSDYQNEITIEKIKISKDKKRATVQTSGVEEGTMPVALSSGQGKEFVPITGTSNCNQIIKLEDDVIQMYSAICNTVVNFQPFD